MLNQATHPTFPSLRVGRGRFSSSPPSWCLFVFLLFSFLHASPVSFDPAPHRAIIDSGVRLTLVQDYDAALSLFEEARKSDPENPLLLYYRALTLEARMIDYETVDAEKGFDSLARRAEAGFRKAVKEEPRNGWARFFLGSLQVTRGAHELRFSHYLNFTKSIVQGIRLIGEAVEIDSSIHDAYIYLGMFEYARSRLFSFLPVFDEDRETPVALVERAVLHATYSKPFARQVLIGLYGHMGEVDKARGLAETFKAEYPANRAVRWIIGNVYLSNKRYDEARAEFEALKILVEAIPAAYPYNRVSVDASLAGCAFKSGRYADCVVICERLLAVKSKDKRLKEFRDLAGRYRARSLKKLR